MHVIFRESQGLEETETPTDLGQSPADMVVLSFSDSDLGAFAEGWRQAGDALPSLRLANLAALKHPLSVDTYIEQTLTGAKAILIRLIGGLPYWSYGIQSVRALAAQKDIALAVLPADGRPDPRLDEVSTLPVSTLQRLTELCDAGGAGAAQKALAELAQAVGLHTGPLQITDPVPMVGGWSAEHGISCPAHLVSAADNRPLVIISFYRAYLMAADLDPIRALCDELNTQGFRILGLFAPSLKVPEAAGWMQRQIAHWQPVAILNATSFSGRGSQGSSPLDAGNVPVFQLALSTATRAAWAEAERGLSPADLAMHVVLPEVDGRLTGGVISFKEPSSPDPDLQFSRFLHCADQERIRAAVTRLKSWTVLAAKPASQRKPALVLSTYPGRDWNMAHAVGLDAPASALSILEDLSEAGYEIAETDLTVLPEAEMTWPLAEYRRALRSLPESLRSALQTAWGAPENEAPDGVFSFRAKTCGKALIALQPERGNPDVRSAEYHDLARVPRHAYVAFYLWLQERADALIHIGAHGTLEWLPGKSAALSKDCWPDALSGSLPVIYPFIVNDPGEAAQAKRRIGAVTLGHIPPPLRASGTPEKFGRLEALLDEFSNADGLDPKRRDRLQDDINIEAQALGLEKDLGIGVDMCQAEALTRIDRFVCDIKESQFGDGLHVWGRPPAVSPSFEAQTAVQAEKAALLNALDGQRIPAGPSGSPYRGRLDVLPTGRNLYTTDPRSVPTRAAFLQGAALAAELIRAHLQDHGDWPRSVVVDLWGSSTMRTAGEDFAMALRLMGVRPVWDEGSERVSGIEIIPLAELDHPRIDVTLRVSGLFRDVFPTLSGLFNQAVRLLSTRAEATDQNPFTAHLPSARVYGPAPGEFGAGLNAMLDSYSEDARRAAGEAWLAASAFALDGEHAAYDPEGIKARVAAADTFVHAQDLGESDLLLASDYAAHEAGFAAAQAVTGGKATLYHLDNTNPDTPRARLLSQEIARVVHARATQPGWIRGMMRHGFRGGAEIAMTLEHMAAFAHLAGVVGPHLFDQFYDATLANDEVTDFLETANPEALKAMRERFTALLEAGLWNSRRNAIRAELEASE